MKKITFKIYTVLFFLISSFNLNADILKKIEVNGNKRISQETIIVYGDIEKNRNYNQTDIDNVIKKLFEIEPVQITRY